MESNSTLKEYYLKLHNLYNNAVNLLTAINQSLTSSSSQVSVKMVDENNVTTTTVKLPSFLYLENKIEEMNSNLETLFNIPNSGEAWFDNNGSLSKLQLIKSNCAPQIPSFSSSNLFASLTDNNILKDLVSPKMFLKLNIDNLTNNIEELYMTKFVIYDESTFNALSLCSSYDDILGKLYNYNKGEQYDVYSSTIKLPIKHDKFNSSFKISNIPTLDSGNPWTDDSSNKLNYQLELDTLQYTNIEDSTIIYTIKAGDYLTLNDANVIYKVKQVVSSQNLIEIEEYSGHNVLTDVETNSAMVLTIYDNDYEDYHYAQIPLEEDEYIIIFLGTIYNNVRSLLSEPLCLNLNNIYMKDTSENYITDNSGNRISYISYYKQYCTNIGDLILGLSQISYPQLSNFNNDQLSQLQNASDIQAFVSDTIDDTTILSVVPINKHLTDDVTSNEIISLHSQKNELQSQLDTLNSNISTIYNSLVSTDFSQNTSVTQSSLKSQLNQYYAERTEIQQQMINVINSINVKAASMDIATDEVKYRIRGITVTEDLEDYLHSTYGENVDIIGCDIEYKYKSVTTDTNTITSINSTLFPDWNKLNNIERQREISFDYNSEHSFEISYINYKTNENIIKWNQVDIPIQQGEDVVIRVRYKYNIGQPYIDLYTPWSEELTIEFPTQYIDSSEIPSILETNEDDTITAKFNKTLINDGYQDHIDNKLIDGSQIYYHMPENIYSGFNTSENKLISLKDKLTSMDNDINTYKQLITDKVNQNYKLYLQYDDKSIELSSNYVNKINILGNDNMDGYYIIKNMNIIIKNAGETIVKLYSIFPGNNNITLPESNITYYADKIANYERVPIIVNNEVCSQRLGQILYFRQNNYFTLADLYLNNENDNKNLVEDLKKYKAKQEGESVDYKPTTNIDLSDYLCLDNKQMMLKFRIRTYDDYIKYNREDLTSNTIYMYWNSLMLDLETNTLNPVIKSISQTSELNELYSNISDDFFHDWSDSTNKILFKYSDICAKDGDSTIYLDNNIRISEFLSKYSLKDFKAKNLTGGFFYPAINSISDILTGNSKDNSYIELNAGKEISIPVNFEYYIDSGSGSVTFKKTIAFDIKTSLQENLDNYIIEVNVNSDSNASSTLYYTDTTNLSYAKE